MEYPISPDSVRTLSLGDRQALSTVRTPPQWQEIVRGLPRLWVTSSHGYSHKAEEREEAGGKRRDKPCGRSGRMIVGAADAWQCVRLLASRLAAHDTLRSP